MQCLCMIMRGTRTKLRSQRVTCSAASVKGTAFVSLLYFFKLRAPALWLLWPLSRFYEGCLWFIPKAEATSTNKQNQSHRCTWDTTETFLLSRSVFLGTTSSTVFYIQHTLYSYRYTLTHATVHVSWCTQTSGASFKFNDTCTPILIDVSVVPNTHDLTSMHMKCSSASLQASVLRAGPAPTVLTLMITF